MNNKETLGRIGFALITFILLILFVDTQDGVWVNLPTVSLNLANKNSLSLLWTTLVTATIIQAFMLYTALLGSNLQFTPATIKKNYEDEI